MPTPKFSLGLIMKFEHVPIVLDYFDDPRILRAALETAVRIAPANPDLMARQRIDALGEMLAGIPAIHHVEKARSVPCKALAGPKD